MECLIGLIKPRYHILDGPMPIQFIKSVKDEARGLSDVTGLDKLVNICAALINMKHS